MAFEADTVHILNKEINIQMSEQSNSDTTRRGFFDKVSDVFMSIGLLAGYGGLAAIATRFLYPAKSPLKRNQFVAKLSEFKPGTTKSYQSPSGQSIAIARLGDEISAESFVALSNVCPHLGCKVHWESNKERFFCPCHNGAFDAQGNPTEGPPKDADQHLSSFPLKLQNDLLFIEVDIEDTRSKMQA